MILESISSNKAEQHNLKYIGFGRWISPYSKKLYVSDGDSVKPYVRKSDRIKYFNNVKSTLSDEEFGNISDRIRTGKIKYIEKAGDTKDKTDFLLNESLSAPDFIYAYVPKKIYNTEYILYVSVELNGRYMEFKSFDDNGFYCWHTLEKKNDNSYKSYIRYLRFPEHMLGSAIVRSYMYNLVNFYNVAKVTNIFVHCGHQRGLYMWGRYGVDFVNSEQRKKFLILIKDKLKNEIIKKANENAEFNKVLKDTYNKIVNCKHLWEITFLTAKLSNIALEYIQKRFTVEPYLDNGILNIGEMLLDKMGMYGVMSLYPDTESYKQYYDYISFKKEKPKQLIKERKDIIDDDEVNGLKLFPSPFYVINKSIKDDRVWKMDNYDKSYQLKKIRENG